MLDDNPELRHQLHTITGAMTVPITRKGDEFIIGWHPAKLMKMIKGE